MPFDPDFYTGDRQLRYINLTRGEYGSDDDIAVDLLEDANVICSDLANGMHKPVIDVDLGVRALQSSTPGHYHLYFETEMTWENYVKLLTTMVEVGLVEPGYLGASEARGYTVARLPWVQKDEEEYEDEVLNDLF